MTFTLREIKTKVISPVEFIKSQWTGFSFIVIRALSVSLSPPFNFSPVLVFIFLFCSDGISYLPRCCCRFLSVFRVPHVSSRRPFLFLHSPFRFFPSNNKISALSLTGLSTGEMRSMISVIVEGVRFQSFWRRCRVF